MVRRPSSLVLAALLIGVAFVNRPARDFGVRDWPAARARSSTCPQLPVGHGPNAADDDMTDFQVTVTPSTNPDTANANFSSNKDTFTVKNTGGCTDTYTYSATPSGAVTGVTLSQTGTTLPPGYTQVVVATYSIGNSPGGTGSVKMTASGTATGSGTFGVTVRTNGPVISSAPHDGDYRDVTKCVANCFDAVAGYATPPYFSWDAPHSVQLVYRSAQANPLGVVQVNARDTTTQTPTEMSILLKNSQGAYVQFTNGATETFYNWAAHPADTNWNRLAAQFAESSLATGDSIYTVAVRSYYSSTSFRESDSTVHIFVLNERTSPFGAGWSIAGFQRLHLQGDGSVVISEGNGSIAWFALTQPGCSSHCAFTSPKGDFTTLRDSSTGADPSYSRRYPDGTTFYFHPDGRLAFVQDRFLNQTSYGYNASNLLVAITDPAGQADSLGYNASNRLAWIKDPGGRTDSITVNASGDLIQIKDWAGGYPFQGTYGPNHLLTRWTDRRSGSWAAGYDFAGKIASVTAPQVTANGQLMQPVVGYASIEQKVLVNWSGNPPPGTSYSAPGANVDTAAVRASTTNARGSTTTYALDRFGAPTLIQEPLGRTTILSRDQNSNVYRSASPSGHIIRNSWSGPNLTQVMDSSHERLRTFNYVYESTYNQVTEIYGDVDTMWNHWSGGHLDSTRVGGSGRTVFVYDATGRMVSDTDAGGNVVTYHHQSSGLQNTDTAYYAVSKVAFQYDGHGQLVKTTNQAGDTMRVQYDSIGRPIQTAGPRGDVATRTYDGLYLTQVQDAKGQTYKSWPNALGWIDSTTDPVGKVDHYQHDLNGNQTSWTNRLSQVLQTTYDSLDQPRSATGGGKTTTFFADPTGRYTADSNSESIDTVWVDSVGRPRVAVSCRVLASGTHCFRDSSAYNGQDLRVQLALSAPGLWLNPPGPTQFFVGYQYDSHSLLDTITTGHFNTGTGDKIARAYNTQLLENNRTLLGLNDINVSQYYVWTAAAGGDSLSDTTLNKAFGKAYQFDSLGRVTTWYQGPSSMPDTTRTFTFDSAGNLTSYYDYAWFYYSNPPPSGCVRHTGGDYCTQQSGDSIHLVPGHAWSRQYDLVGNPTTGVDPGNRLRAWQSLRMDYDAAGNLVAKRTLRADTTQSPLRTDSLYWSVLGRLDSVRTHDSLGNLTWVRFGYDGWGRRIRKSTASGTSRYLWDGDALLAELDSAGNDLAAYTDYPGTDHPAAVLRHDRADSTYYYFQDHSGNVLGLLKRTSGGVSIANEYWYDPFGGSLGASTSLPNSRQFAGREYDVETQLYYHRARYYDPAVGRFISEDPIGVSGGRNSYLYAGNDPVNSRDPGGTCSAPAEKDVVIEADFIASEETASCGQSGGGNSDANSPQYDPAQLAAAVNTWLQQNFGTSYDEQMNIGDDQEYFFSDPTSLSLGNYIPHTGDVVWISNLGNKLIDPQGHLLQYTSFTLDHLFHVEKDAALVDAQPWGPTYFKLDVDPTAFGTGADWYTGLMETSDRWWQITAKAYLAIRGSLKVFVGLEVLGVPSKKSTP